MKNEDLSVFFDDEVFADTLTFTGAALASPVEITGIWDSPFSDPVDVHSVDVYVTCPTEQADQIPEGARLTRASKNYRVMAKPEADGTGVSIIRLELI